MNDIVFIDSNISDYQSLLRGLPVGSEVIILDKQRDGLQQIAAALKARHDLDAIHIIGHGSSGQIQLGSTFLNSNNLKAYQPLLTSIGASLNLTGDLLLYGCNVAQGAQGSAFIQQLSQLTGADMAASIDLTGSAALGGNWQLESRAGRIEAQQLALDYSGTLATTINIPANTAVYGWHNTHEQRNCCAFAAIKDDGSVVTWGAPQLGGSTSQVINQLNGTNDVIHLFSTSGAFAALRVDGSVVTWGDAEYGGNSSTVVNKLNGTVNITQLFSNDHAFAALRADGSVVTWGQPSYGGDSTEVASQLNGTTHVTRVVSSEYNFAALRDDGSVVTWGQSLGVNPASWMNMVDGSIPVTRIYSNMSDFSAIRADGSVVYWGRLMGFSGTIRPNLDGTESVTQIYATSTSFAALLANGSVVTWGNDASGGDSRLVTSQLDGTVAVTDIFSNMSAFAALRSDGSVVTWGEPLSGGYMESYDYSITYYPGVYHVDETTGELLMDRTVSSELSGAIDITTIYSTTYAFAALRSDGSVVTWGWSRFGGDSSAVARQLNGTVDVTQIFSNGEAFAALRVDGSVVTWGDSKFGGDSNAVANKLNGTIDVTEIFSTDDGGFAALRADGSVVTWGNANSGGDSRAVASQLSANVLAFADIHSNEMTRCGTPGNDVINGYSGADIMAGGDGSDSYYVDNGGDRVIERNANAAIGGTDIVYSYLAAYTLTNHVENGRLLASGNANLTGNGLNNVLYANAASNVLNGGGGTDTVSYLYAATAGVTANLASSATQATGGSGNDKLISIENLTGSSYNDVLTGNSGVNVLNGSAGADTLIGGDGDDIYVIDNPGDKAVETNTGSSGVDLIKSYLSYNLTDTDGDGSNGGNIENLQLMGLSALNATGNALENLLYANSADNVIDGGEGIDTVSYRYGASAGIIVSLAPLSAAQTTGGSGIDTLISIENLIGSTYNDTLSGDSAANLLDGGAGLDRLTGGNGGDTYVVDNSGDIVVETNAGSSGGVDLVQAFVSYGLTDHVENLRLMGTAHLSAAGNGLNNIIDGNNGNNFIDGGTGADNLDGGNGNDTYVVDNNGDIVIETNSSTTGGNDLVQAFVSYTLVANVENLRLMGTTALNATGNPLNNVIDGNSANNGINGGAGADSMRGGDGSDSYIVDNTSDTVVETNAASAGGTDLIQASVSYGLPANTENLRLTGTADLNAYGNGLDNRIEGNSGDNLINGGMGADRLIGGDGSDTYIVDNLADIVVETNPSGIGGIDAIQTTVSYKLAANVENLRLLGSGALNATGNALNNRLEANSADNIISGGDGIDTVSYQYGATSGVIVRLAASGASQATGGSGSDTLLGIENLTGSIYNDFLGGSNGNNVLAGGMGSDFLFGNGGNDVFVFNALGEMGSSIANADTIFDFKPGDKIDLSALDANTTTALNDAFSSFIAGSAAFTAPGQLKLLDEMLYGNTDADTAAEFAISLIGVSNLTMLDIIA